MELTQIKQIRKKIGLTQSQLAKQSGLSQSLIAKIEAGSIDPTYTKAQQLFSVLNQLQSKDEKTAKDIMFKKVIIVSSKDSIIDTIKKMKKHSISQLPVVDNGIFVGLISESEIINKIASNKDINKLKVIEVMKECPPIISPNAKKGLILDLLKHYSILLVANKGKINGLISKADILDTIF